MDKFVVSARKYRPATFDSVIGQESVTRTLRNAIKSGNLGQSFLFCGPRGVGKTTCARILAKAINCENINEQAEPCNKCGSCQSFADNASYNIFELDAASNSHVDDIRALIEQVRYAPQSGKYKVYIIDEVHMLSASAFNAFLKTLEEPPSYAIFILATTEKHKILPTILSRCQIYDFSRIMPSDMVSALLAISEKEGVSSDEDALHMIAEKADGAMRDALSIFDRLVSFTGNQLAYADVISGLNLLDHDYYFKITDNLIAANAAQTLLIYNEILRNGFEGDLFLNGLGSHLRDLLVCKDGATISLMEGSEQLKSRYQEQSQKCSQDILLNALQIVSELDSGYRMARNKSLHVELGLLRICYLDQTIELVKDSLNPSKKKQPEAVAEVPKVADTSVSASPKTSKSSATSASEAASDPIEVRKDEETAKKEKDVAQEELPTKEEIDDSAEEDEIPDVSAVGESKEEKVTDSGPSLLSLDDIRNEIIATEDVLEAEEVSRKVDESIVLDVEALKKAWNFYTTKMEKEGNMSVCTLLKVFQPEVDRYKVIMKVENEMQKDTLADVRIEILEYLEVELKLDGIELVIEIDKNSSISGPDIPVTMKDKFERMKEKNPDLEELQRRLGLELDY